MTQAINHAEIYANNPAASAKVISLGGSGEEVSVSKGFATVASVEAHAAGTVNVKLTSTNPKIKRPIQGWTQVTETAVIAILEEAKETGRPIAYRVESQRKDRSDLTTPIEEVIARGAIDHIRSILAAVQFADSSDPIIYTGEAVTHELNDPSATGRKQAEPNKPATTGTPAGVTVNAPTVTLEQIATAADSSLAQGVIDNLVATAVMQGMDIADITAALAGTRRNDTTKPVRHDTFSTEAPSWKLYNSDGRLNLGSSAVMGAVSAENMITKTLLEKEIITVNNIDTYEIKTLINYLITVILYMSDQVQVRTYGTGFRADRSTGSHTRARGIVYDTIENFFPVPAVTDPTNEEDRATIKQWGENVIRVSTSRYKVSTNAFEHIKETPDYIYVNNITPTTQELATEEQVKAIGELWKREGEGFELNLFKELIIMTFGKHKVQDVTAEELAGFLKAYNEEGALARVLEYISQNS